ncbi:MAG: DUF2799 domain-containing protein [Granulosicoccus sp.]|nr:DUF2799 domain-containing protein [Granulosicoccus sp.]
MQYTSKGFLSCSILSLLLLSGCATLDKSECLRGDWTTVGYKDGKRGLDPDQQMARHTKACGKHDISPDRALYDEGFAQGLQVYCTPESGYELATDEKEYRGVCPASLEGSFLESYIAGLQVVLDRLDTDIDDMTHEVDDAEYDLSYLSRQKEPDKKKLKEAREELDSARSRLSSEKSNRRKFRRWLDKWTAKTRG